MKKYKLLPLIFMAMSFTIMSQSFETDRLPIGDSDRKYDFCAVKLDKQFDTDLDKETSFKEMIEALRQKRIVLIGETHTNQLHHDVQYEIIKGLVESAKPVVLALEMFNPNQNEQLAAWSSGETDPNTFLEQTDFLTTWSHNYRYYEAIFDYVREKHIPIYGANVERKYASKIGRGGLSSLTEEERSTIPDIDTSTVEHKYFFKVAMEGMDAIMPKIFNNMYQAQSLWDAAMGEGAITAANKHPDATVVVLAGSGHVVYNLGIGRIIKDRSDLSFVSVVVVDVPDEVEDSGMMKIKKDTKKNMPKEMSQMKSNETPKEDSLKNVTPKNAHMMGMTEMDNTPNRIVARSLADYLLGKKETKRDKYPSFGFSVKDKEDQGYPIKRVLPETIAAENGLMTGDIIITIDEKEFKSLFDLKKHLQYKNWNEEISFQIRRGDEVKIISFTIEPVEE
ncbi:MAG: ChaN family lipoprotein [Ignavibacteriaceae bacterium]|jgi:uncharacterized iron-regulated protein